jgi:hypothetical protein
LLTEPSDASREVAEVRLVEELMSEAEGLSSGGSDSLATRREGLAQRVLQWSIELSKGCNAQSTWSAGKGQPEEIRDHLMSLIEPWFARRYFEQQLQSDSTLRSVAAFLPELKRCCRRLFAAKVVVLEDSDTSGDGVLNFVFRVVPPGLHARTLGCQNIKGTGLDFIYRFMEIQTVNGALTRLVTEAGERSLGLSQMRNQSYGYFACQLAIDRLRQLIRDSPAEWQPHVTAVSEVLADLEGRQRVASARMNAGASQSRWQRALGWFEPLIDHLDGVRRRKRAQATMHALIASHIDVSTAAQQLRDVVARQKGGWLAKDAARLLSRFRAATPAAPRLPSESSVPGLTAAAPPEAPDQV